MLTAIAVLFSMMLALPRQAQAQNTVTIDGVTKNILSTEFAYGDGDANAFAATLYLSSDKKEYVLVTGNQKLHATYKYILPTSYEPRHDEQWYWGVEYTKNGYGNELFRSWADPTESWSLFSSGVHNRLPEAAARGLRHYSRKRQDYRQQAWRRE